MFRRLRVSGGGGSPQISKREDTENKPFDEYRGICCRYFAVLESLLYSAVCGQESIWARALFLRFLTREREVCFFVFCLWKRNESTGSSLRSRIREVKMEKTNYF